MNVSPELSGKVVEVYPAPAQARWGINATGYKSKAGAGRLPDFGIISFYHFGYSLLLLPFVALAPARLRQRATARRCRIGSTLHQATPSAGLAAATTPQLRPCRYAGAVVGAWRCRNSMCRSYWSSTSSMIRACARARRGAAGRRLHPGDGRRGRHGDPVLRVAGDDPLVEDERERGHERRLGSLGRFLGRHRANHLRRERS